MSRTIPKRMLVLVGVSFLVMYTLYYLLTSSMVSTNPGKVAMFPDLASTSSQASIQYDVCSSLRKYPADIETSDTFPTLELEPDWLERREYWSNQMEDRFQRRKQLWSQVPLKVIVMPHSHNDPGWLKTIDGYFATATKSIITNIVEKLTVNTNMTFIWTEMSYLSLWWEGASPDLQAKMRSLIDSGRLEIPTGGWVMTDEANVELFSMIDQLVEGHSFLRSTFNVRPESSWSVDSFGHGGTFPHILAKAGINNMVVMRVHYAWKEWFAKYQQGDFLWKQAWESDGSQSPLCHNFPYDIYSIKHSCGPHPQTCLGFDYRHVVGEYNEFSLHYTPIDASNVEARAELLLEQYGRTGSLFPHNVVLVPLGDDFRYNNAAEFDQQYSNYMQLMEFINSRSDKYHATVSFGNLIDYFTAVRDRMSQFSTLTGDFHVYSDVFSEGRPAYWSGYYSTRPYLKKLSRTLAGKLRSAEILYSLSRGGDKKGVLTASGFDQLETARRDLGLFQHHDAITGTSKHFVMVDYQNRLLRGLMSSESLIEIAAQLVLENESPKESVGVLQHVTQRHTTGDTSNNVLNMKYEDGQTVVVYNSLAQEKEEVVIVMVSRSDVCVTDSSGSLVETQISPLYNITQQNALDLGVFQLVFVSLLPALSLSTFNIRPCAKDQGYVKQKKTKVYCLMCPDTDKEDQPYSLSPLPEGLIQLENQVYSLQFDSQTKLLSSINNKLSGTVHSVENQFIGYPSEPFRSGAYLLSVETSYAGPVFSPQDLIDVVIVSGLVWSQLTLMWKVGGEGGASTFVTTYRLYHTTGPTSEGIKIENMFDFGPTPNFRDREVVMRFASDIKSGRSFYTDQAGFSVIRRDWVEGLSLSGNHYPVTQATYLQDTGHRLTLVVDHATGASSVQEGHLEVMVDRRTMYDDARGMGEGVTDNRPTTHGYWLLLEPRDPSYSPSTDTLPSLSPLATILSRYLDNPSTVLSSSTPMSSVSISLLKTPLPCDHHLINLRSWTPRSVGPHSALMTLHRTGPDCSWATLSMTDCVTPAPSPNIIWKHNPATFSPVSLTGNFVSPRPTSTGSMFSLSPMEIAAYNVTFS